MTDGCTPKMIVMAASTQKMIEAIRASSKYDKDCDNRDYDEWEVMDTSQIKLKGTNLCLTYDEERVESPSEDDRMIIRMCREMPRYRYDLGRDLV